MSIAHDGGGLLDDIAVLRARLDAAEARASALAEVLQVINRSPGNPQPVFDAILGHAMRLCDTACGVLYTWDGTHFHLAAHRGVPAAFADFRSREPTPPTPQSSAARLLESRGAVRILDFREEATYRSGTAEDRASADLGGARSTLLVPLLKDGEVRGMISTYRQEVRAFDDMQIVLLESFAAQAVIAMENARLLGEQQEALERQTATAEVLAVINANPGNLVPVFDAMLARAMRLCGATVGALHTTDGTAIRTNAMRGMPEAYVEFRGRNPVTGSEGTPSSRVLSSGKPVNIADMTEEEIFKAGFASYRAIVELGGVRAHLNVPLLRDGTAVGFFAIYRKEIGAFSDRQVALLENFAAQAVIAMDNARLLTEQQEALEQQKASADILTVISTSMGDVQPVFEKILESCQKLFDGDELDVLLVDEQGLLQVAAYVGRFRDEVLATFPAPVDITPAGPAIRERRVAHYTDIMNNPDTPPVLRRIGAVAGYHSVAFAPMIWQDRGIGVVGVARARGAFSERELAVLQSFAAQAVIAIQNTRLITEQQEALERQTATAEVLQVINANPGNLAPVFEVMLEKAMRLAGATFGILDVLDGEHYRSEATIGAPEAYLAFRKAGPMLASDSATVNRFRETGKPFHVLDVLETESYKSGEVLLRGAYELGEIRSFVGVPMMKNGAVVGIIWTFRQEVRAFTDKQIALLESFAAQAVIAMENARLLTEQQEALERQTATAEVLSVINANPGNLAPVFNVILAKAHALCGADRGCLFLHDGTNTVGVAVNGYDEDVAAVLMQPIPTAETGTAQALLAGARYVQTADIRALTQPPTGAIATALRHRSDVRTSLLIPLRKDGVLLGLMSANRIEVRPYKEAEIALLENFAAQAVIAMENARLLTEQQEALEQQKASSDILTVISTSMGDVQPVFDKILESCKQLFDGDELSIGRVDEQGLLHLAAYVGRFPEVIQASFPAPLEIAAIGRAIRERRMVHYPDIDNDPAVPPSMRRLAMVAGYHSAAFAPMVWQDQGIGVVGVASSRRAFTERQLQVLQSFADQAVIAIQNTRLITEQREALERQTATAEVLQVINANPGNLAPVFEMILEKAHHLCDAGLGSLQILDGAQLRAVAVRGLSDALADYLKAGFAAPEGLLRGGGQPTQVDDLAAYSAENSANPAVAPAWVELRGYRALLVPLHKDGVLLGRIVAARQAAGKFTDRQIALLENFAAQAVIAMDNARLLTELQARDEDNRRLIARQSASIDILKAISASPDDPQPVFELIARLTLELCTAAAVTVAEYDGAVLDYRAMAGIEPDREARMRAAFPRPPGREFVPGRVVLAGEIVIIPDVQADMELFAPARGMGGRTAIGLPIFSEGRVIGVISPLWFEVRPHDDAEIALLQSFAEQAAIAIASAKALRALRTRTDELAQREDELRVTFENMGDGVAMFDESRRLVAWNRKFQDILDLPDDALAQGLGFADYIRTLAGRGEFGADADTESQVQRLLASLGQQRIFERTRPNGHTVEVRNNPVADGGFVLIYADITERKRAEAEIAAARDAAEQAARTIEAAYRELKIAQANLVQAEKMASLGQLTAGIAHEIKNPLNFVNNFSDLSVELLGELTEAIAPAVARLGDDVRADVDDLTATLTSNLRKITEHGRRADGIVRSMLEHSRGSSGERRSVDLNAVVEEALNLAYHGARAQDQSFNITLERDFAAGMAPITLTPQDITRVFLNLFSNGFYAANQWAKAGGDAGFAPRLAVSTRDLGDAVEIRVRDNGTGVPPEVREKLFEPFFTTKPTGEGTGLGLSISYDIVTKQHGGSIAVDSAPGVFTEFTVILPRQGMAG